MTAILAIGSGIQNSAPTIIQISAEGERPNSKAYDIAFREVKEPKVLTELKDGNLAAKLSDSTLLYITKATPAIKNLRARQFLYHLVEEAGLNTPIPFQKIEQSEFKDVLYSFWWQHAEQGASQTSLFAVSATLESSTFFAGSIRSASFGPRLKATPESVNALRENHLVNVKTPEQAQEYRSGHYMSYGGKPYSICISRPLSYETEIELSRTALDTMRGYLHEQLDRLQNELEQYLSKEPLYASTITRRKARTMDELKNLSRNEYDTMMAIIGGTGSSARVDIDQLSRSQLSHSYALTLYCFGSDGKYILFPLSSQ